MRSLGLFSLALTFGFVVSGSASAHIDVLDPPMRGGDQKKGPCEEMPRGDSPKAYTGGEKALVTWNETVPHDGGYFRINLDPAGDKFDADGDDIADYPPSKGNAGGNGDESLKLVDVPDKTAAEGQSYEAEITIPNIDCDQCTLQVVQMMGDKEPSQARPTNHIYFRCSDITITKSDDPGGGGAGGEATGGAPAGGAGGAPAGGEGGMGGTTMMPEDPEPEPPEPMEPGVNPPPVVPGPDDVPPDPPAGDGTGGAGTSGGSDAPDAMGDADESSTDDGGCALKATTESGAGSAWGLALLGLAFLRRRRK